MLPKCCIPMIISSLVLAGFCFLDTSRDNPAASSILGSVALGVAITVIVLMPAYAIAGMLRDLLRWAEWTRLFLVVVFPLCVLLILWLTTTPQGSGLSSLPIKFIPAFQLWLVSLTYGAPAVITNYWVAARERRDYSP